MGRLTPRLNSHSRFTQEMRKSWGSSWFGIRRNEIALNFVPHHGHSSSGIGDGMLSLFMKRIVRNLAVSGSSLPSVPCDFGVAARLTHQADFERPVSQLGHILQPLQLQSADERCRTAQLIQGQEVQSVTHKDA